MNNLANHVLVRHGHKLQVRWSRSRIYNNKPKVDAFARIWRAVKVGDQACHATYRNQEFLGCVNLIVIDRKWIEDARRLWLLA